MAEGFFFCFFNARKPILRQWMFILVFFLVTDMFWQTGGLIGGHGASSHRVSPKTRPKEARRTLNAGVALFIQGFIARMTLSSQDWVVENAFFSCVGPATAATGRSGPFSCGWAQTCFLVMWIWPKKSAAVCRVATLLGYFFRESFKSCATFGIFGQSTGEKKQNACW